MASAAMALKKEKAMEVVSDLPMAVFGVNLRQPVLLPMGRPMQK
ncbi:MAG: hypothetical protein ABFD50_23055 [Smithella sp.]